MHIVFGGRGEHGADGGVGMGGEQGAATENGVVEMGRDDEKAWGGFAHGLACGVRGAAGGVSGLPVASSQRAKNRGVTSA
jgi:hypothetical protein